MANIACPGPLLLDLITLILCLAGTNRWLAIGNFGLKTGIDMVSRTIFPASCAEVHTALTAAALQWCADDDSSLSLTWCRIVDSFDAQGSEAHHHAIWSFALWGRECLYDLNEHIEDPDHFLRIEEEYLHLLDDMPVSSLFRSSKHVSCIVLQPPPFCTIAASVV